MNIPIQKFYKYIHLPCYTRLNYCNKIQFHEFVNFFQNTCTKHLKNLYEDKVNTSNYCIQYDTPRGIS